MATVHNPNKTDSSNWHAHLFRGYVFTDCPTGRTGTRSARRCYRLVDRFGRSPAGRFGRGHGWSICRPLHAITRDAQGRPGREGGRAWRRAAVRTHPNPDTIGSISRGLNDRVCLRNLIRGDRPHASCGCPSVGAVWGVLCTRYERQSALSDIHYLHRPTSWRKWQDPRDSTPAKLLPSADTCEVQICGGQRWTIFQIWNKLVGICSEQLMVQSLVNGIRSQNSDHRNHDSIGSKFTSRRRRTGFGVWSLATGALQIIALPATEAEPATSCASTAAMLPSLVHSTTNLA